MDIHERHGREKVRLDELPVRDHNTELSSVVDRGQHIVWTVGHRDTAGESSRFDRGRRKCRTPPATTVGLRNDEDDLVPGIEKRIKWRYRRRRGAEVDELHGEGVGRWCTDNERTINAIRAIPEG